METMLDKMMPLWFAASIFAASFAITIGIYAARGIAKMTREIYEYASDALDEKTRHHKRRRYAMHQAAIARTVNAI